MKSTLIIIILAVFSFTAFAQDEMFTGGTKEKNEKTKKEKPKKEKREEKKKGDAIFVLPDMSINLDMKRGAILNAGIRIASGNTKIISQYVSVNFSIPFIPGNHTAVGMFYKCHPFNGGLGKMIGVGLDFEYFFKSDIKGYSEFFFGGKLNNTIKGAGIQWDARRLVLAPRIEFLVPIRNWKIGVTSNPLLFGYWDYLKDSGKWDVVRRWYNIAFTVQLSFPTKKLNKFLAEQKK